MAQPRATLNRVQCKRERDERYRSSRSALRVTRIARSVRRFVLHVSLGIPRATSGHHIHQPRLRNEKERREKKAK